MYVKISAKTAYKVDKFVGGAVTMEVIDDTDEIEVPIVEVSMKLVGENSSVVSLDLLNTALRRINPGSIHSVELYCLDKQGGYLATAVCNLNKWIKNGFRKENGELLANIDKLKKLVNLRNKLAVTLDDGTTVPLPITVYNFDSMEDRKRARQLALSLSKTAMNAATAELKAKSKCKGEVFTYSKVKEA